MLVVPHQGRYPGLLFRPPEQRASDADRDTAVDILCAAAADGRLTMTELDERVGSALTARTLAQLAHLTADLIGLRAAAASPGPPPTRAFSAPGDRWAVLRSLLDLSAAGREAEQSAQFAGERY
jgi:hypothetical protein